MLRAKMVALSCTVDRLSNAPCVSNSRIATCSVCVCVCVCVCEGGGGGGGGFTTSSVRPCNINAIYSEHYNSIMVAVY